MTHPARKCIVHPSLRTAAPQRLFATAIEEPAMSMLRQSAPLLLALAALPMLSSCSEDVATVETMPPSPPPTAVGTASGTGTLMQTVWGNQPNTPPERKKVELAAKFAYAYPSIDNGERTVWMVATDQAPDTAGIDAADDRSDALRVWCGKVHANFSALQLDSHGTAKQSFACAGDGRLDSAHLSEDSTMSSRGKSALTVNDGKRLEGTFTTGVGSMRVGDIESFAETTGDYHVAADLAPLTLRDRVSTSGDDHATGVPGAKAAFLKYWKAAGNAKSLAEIDPWFTPDRHAHTEAQIAEVAEMGWTPERMLKMFAEGHAGSANITAAKAIGAAAVVTADATSGDGAVTCQTLMLQLQGAWKVGDERCRMQARPRK
jgi:hypothetical protein